MFSKCISRFSNQALQHPNKSFRSCKRFLKTAFSVLPMYGSYNMSHTNQRSVDTGVNACPCPCPPHDFSKISCPCPRPCHGFWKISCPCPRPCHGFLKSRVHVHVHVRDVDVDTGVHKVRVHVHRPLVCSLLCIHDFYFCKNSEWRVNSNNNPINKMDSL